MNGNADDNLSAELLNAYEALRSYYRYSATGAGNDIEEIRQQYSEVIERAFKAVCLCKWCKNLTDNSTSLCERCKELYSHIEKNPNIAKRMLGDNAPETTVAENPGAGAEPSPKRPPEPGVRLDVGEVAARLTVSPATIYRSIIEGHIPGGKIGRRVYVDRTGLIAFLDDEHYRGSGEMLPAKYMTTREVAHKLGVGNEMISMLARTGALRAVHLRKKWIFQLADVECYKENMVNPRGTP